MATAPVNLSEPISLRLPADLLAEIDVIAKICERSRSWIIVRALKQYRATEGADVLAAKEGLDQIERGEYVDMDDLLEEMDRIIGSNETA